MISSEGEEDPTRSDTETNSTDLLMILSEKNEFFEKNQLRLQQKIERGSLRVANKETVDVEIKVEVAKCSLDLLLKSIES